MVRGVDGSRAARAARCDNPPVTTTPSITTPVGIHADRAAGTLAIDWADGHRTVFDAEALRWLCPCAYCRGEAGMPGWLDSSPTLTAEQTRLVDVQLVGNYALRITFSDGHHTGIYSWETLYMLGKNYGELWTQYLEDLEAAGHKRKQPS